MNTPTNIVVHGEDARQKQLLFQSTVAQRSGFERIEFHRGKAYAYSPGKSKPQIFKQA